MSANYDVLLHLDNREDSAFKLVARNAQNYLNALPDEKFGLIVVANAGAVNLFTLAREDLRALATPLVARGVRFLLCANALAENKIDRDRVWPECEVVPAGLVEIVRLQRAGYAYVKP
ncbi:MAG: DsrE family protein [Desulfovibrio sp.]|nr:DsrE family protein [Desulfovibrio sp.]